MMHVATARLLSHRIATTQAPRMLARRRLIVARSQLCALHVAARIPRPFGDHHSIRRRTQCANNRNMPALSNSSPNANHDTPGNDIPSGDYAG